MSRPLKQREIACARCFRLKRKCDHAKPTCGECRRKGAECIPARSRKTGESITVPLAYLKNLERRVAELEGLLDTTNTKVGLCDVGVQTDPVSEDEGVRVHTPSSAIWMPDSTSKANTPKPKIDCPEDESALVPFPDTPQLGLWSRSPSQTSFTDAFSLWNEQHLDFLRVNTAPAYPLLCDNSPWLRELYTNIYFSISHREWPFLNESAWKKWHGEEGLEGHGWRTFFLRMVYAIGASLCSTMHRDPLHRVRSKELYASAMSYYPHVVGHSSMVLQVQASLLLIVYALHSSSSEEIDTSVSSILPFCTAAMAEIRKYERANGDDELTVTSGEAWTENMFITCYMLNEIIACGWDRPASAAYRAIDDDVSESFVSFLWLLAHQQLVMYTRRHHSTPRPNKSGSGSSLPSTKNPITYKKVIGKVPLAILRGETNLQFVTQIGTGYLETRHSPIWNRKCIMWILPSELDGEAIRLQYSGSDGGEAELP